MTPRIRRRDPHSTAAAEQMIAAAAAALVDAHAAAAAGYARLLRARSSGPVDWLQALATERAAAGELEEAKARFEATCLLGGATRYGVAEASGCRVGTLRDRIDRHPVAARIRQTRGCDLVKADNGRWLLR